MDSAAIDTVLPALVNQYRDSSITGGGIWPLPNRRDLAKEKASSFVARNAAGDLEANAFWNTDGADEYWEQPWFREGMTAEKGQCAWVKAYQDDATPQLLTTSAVGTEWTLTRLKSALNEN